MISTTPSIGVTFPVTNPLSMGYFAYLAAADAWAKIADQVVIVDGGSSDGSLVALRQWVGDRNNIKILHTVESTWGGGEKFHLLQVNINFNIGLASLETDWAFVVGGDYVPIVSGAKDLVVALNAARDDLVVEGTRYKIVNGKVTTSARVPVKAINLRLMRTLGTRLGYGVIKGTRTLSDHALRLSGKTTYFDPLTKVRKTIFSGDRVPAARTIGLSVFVYGHFFFTPERALSHCKRWDRATSRFFGLAPTRSYSIKIDNSLLGISGSQQKEIVLSWRHPDEVRKVIREYFRSGMLGGAIRQVSPGKKNLMIALRKLLGLERHIRTRQMRAKGYRGLKELHRWVAIDAPDPEPLDVAQIYKEQDRFLPTWAKG